MLVEKGDAGDGRERELREERQLVDCSLLSSSVTWVGSNDVRDRGGEAVNFNIHFYFWHISYELWDGLLIPSSLETERIILFCFVLFSSTALLEGLPRSWLKSLLSHQSSQQKETRKISRERFVSPQEEGKFIVNYQRGPFTPVLLAVSTLIVRQKQPKWLVWELWRGLELSLLYLRNTSSDFCFWSLPPHKQPWRLG